VTITTSDVPQVSATIRVAGELFEVHGALMLALAADWRAGARAANLDPDTGGNRWQPCTDPACTSCPHAIPSDPTGEAAINQARGDMADELQTRLARVVEDCYWLRDTAHVLAPIVPPSQMNEKDDLWCSHHLRIGLAEVRHRKDLCRFCDDFLKLWKIRPPVSLLRDKHQGVRLTEAKVKAALEADGVILSTVGGVTKAIRQARPGRQRNQNEKKRK
jgi:hypothetical protein